MMKRISILASLLLVTTLAFTSRMECHDSHEKVKYVKGGACEPGNGSKKHPYTSLKQAQDNSNEWDVLTVLSSTIPLDGGITLKDGQKLIGEEDPTSTALSPTQPTITNTDSTLTLNGGNGVVVASGDATIENIHFTNIQASGIKYDNAQNLKVKNVLVTNYNLSVVADGGIEGFCSTSGKASIQHVVVRNASESNGIVEVALSGVQRELSVCDSEIAHLDGIEGLYDGIFIDTRLNSSSEVSIEDCYFHHLDEGVELNAAGGAQVVRITGSVFRDLAGLDTFSNDGSSLKLKVDACLFENTDDGVFEISTSNSSCEVLVENSVINSPGEDAFALFITVDDTSGSNQKLCLINNVVTAAQFLTVLNVGQQASLSTTEVVAKDNFFTGPLGIEIASFSPWKLLKIEPDHNCFVGNGTQPALFSRRGPAGNATVQAHKNSFSGFVPDIRENNSAGVLYDVSKNWWGHATSVPCTPGPCGFAQTCVNGFCQGPTVIGATKVDASNPLAESIKCPHNCCNRLPIPPNRPPEEAVESTPSGRSEKRAKKVAAMKARLERTEPNS